ncbi:unnamed protein product [Lactuca saligna]|uniref:Uncharacterized protein n=1 Tax=Lactuca saligna TaxID=75948 RepID=A0AA35Z687_LACSI|nr:unnamed protein product [Lactuca saligna]
MSLSVIFTICLFKIPFIVKIDAKSIRSNSSDAFVIGAIVDMSSRVGKEARIAMEVARDDFSAKTNQNLTLYTTNSKRNIVQAIHAVTVSFPSLAGRKPSLKLQNWKNSHSVNQEH